MAIPRKTESSFDEATCPHCGKPNDETSVGGTIEVIGKGRAVPIRVHRQCGMDFLLRRSR